MDDYSDINDQLVTDQVQGDQQANTQDEAPQSQGMRQLREAYQREKNEKIQKDLEIATMKARLEMIEQGYSKAPVHRQEDVETDYQGEIDSMDDDLPSGAQVKKVMGGLVGEIKRLKAEAQSAKSQANNSTLSPIERARLKYEDYTRVVNKEAIDKYLTNSAIRELIDATEPNKQPELAYRIIKGEIEKEASGQKRAQTSATIQVANTKPASINQTGRNLTMGEQSKDISRMNTSEKSDLRARAMDQIRQFVRQANSVG
jgi:hypothetical protein